MTTVTDQVLPSTAARGRFESCEAKPFLLNDWNRAAFIHYEVNPQVLQAHVPFTLDLWQGRAFVSLVAFTMQRLRIASGGRWLRWVTAPVANHGFLNVRTHVVHRGEPGIYFLTEYLPNVLSVMMGPRTYGLPFHLGDLRYRHEHELGRIRGCITPAAAGAGRLRYHARRPIDSSFVPCLPDSRDAFMLERYTAFTERHGVQRCFRIWHEPWRVQRLEMAVTDVSLLARAGRWAAGAKLVGAHYSPGAKDVWMSRPRCINGRACDTVWNGS